MTAIVHPIIGLTLNYRDAARTSRCVASLLDDGANGVLVWDNSEDNEVSSKNLPRDWSDDARVHMLVSPRNLGFSAGVNRGIEAILKRWPTAWIMLINNDAALRPGALTELSNGLLKNPKAVIAYPRIDHGGRELGTRHCTTSVISRC